MFGEIATLPIVDQTRVCQKTGMEGFTHYMAIFYRYGMVQPGFHPVPRAILGNHSGAMLVPCLYDS